MAAEVQLIKVCNVISVKDDQGLDRIKVRMIPEDNDFNDEQLIEMDNNYVFPLLPKMFFVKPKVKECVLVICATNNGEKQRYYIGPVISQQNQIAFDPFLSTARSMYKGSKIVPPVAPALNSDTKGAFPDDEDVFINGRRDADIQIKENDIRLRCGVKKASWADKNNFTFNTNDPAYVLLRYYDSNIGKDDDENKCCSVANIVADKINLIGRKSGHRVTDREDLITDESMKEIIDSAHQLPYGDKLVEFLKIFKKAFMNHTHNHYLLTPNLATDGVPELQTYFLDEILSKNVRID